MKDTLIKELNKLLNQVSKEELRRNNRLKGKTKKLKVLIKKLSLIKGK